MSSINSCELPQSNGDDSDSRDASAEEPKKLRHRDVVIRIRNPIEILRDQLIDSVTGKPKNKTEGDNRVIYSSTLVDAAGNMELVRETAEACNLILENTYWQIRLLSKSNLFPKLVELIPEKYHSRLILGMSTGTLNDKLAAAFERGCPYVSMRLKALHWLQDRGFRTFGMICPFLPQDDYDKFAKEMAEAIRVEKCEHVWAEVFNGRGNNLVETVEVLRQSGFGREADLLSNVIGADNVENWEDYWRSGYYALLKVIPAEKLRFLQY